MVTSAQLIFYQLQQVKLVVFNGIFVVSAPLVRQIQMAHTVCQIETVI